MSASAGRVLLIPRGNYDSTAVYNPLDFVYYNSSSYVCKQPATGILPTNTTYWQIMVEGAVNISDMQDVQITIPISNGQIMSYNATVSKWENANLPDSPITTLSGTLDAGQTTLTITDSHITSTSIIDVYTDQNDIKQPTMSVSNNTLTMVFEEQSVDLNVKVVII